MAAYRTEDWERHWTAGDTPWSASGNDSALPLFHQRLCPHLPHAEPRRALIPLCGASSAVRYLYDQGYSVVGVDLIPRAIETLVARSFPEVTMREEVEKGFRILSAPRIQLWIGDFFQLPRSPDTFHLIYDCASYVALSRSQLDTDVPLIERDLDAQGVYAIVANEFTAVDWKGPPYPFDRREALARFEGFEIIDETSERRVRTEPRFVEHGITETREYRIALRRTKT